MNPLNKLGMVAGLAALPALCGAQSIGSACGCPDVSARTPVNMSTLLDGSFNLLSASTTLTCDKVYTLSSKMYVNAGQDLYIEPGTVIKVVDNSGVNSNAVIVCREGQIWANGSESCPIIFTSVSDALDGSYAVTNRGKWGGLIVLGRAFNNVRSTDLKDGGPAASTSITGTDGVGLIEGLSAGDTRHYYGMAVGSEIPTDNSGILRYVSLRHGGELLGTANEINGLTLGSVGSGTQIDHIEVTSNLDDGFEFFGGTVSAHHLVAMHCDDDYIDYDQGYTGRIQFFYGLQGPDNSGGALNQGDNGMECDGDDGPGNSAAKSNPVIYNATIIGRGPSGDESIESRREALGSIYNSIFANFRSGLSLSDVAYTNWNGGTFQVKNCTFQYRADQTTTGDPVADTFKRVRVNGGNASAADYTKFTSDGNLTTAQGTLIDASFAISPLSSNTVTDRVNPVPAAGTASSTLAPPVDGFFTGAKYRGAFEPGQAPWTQGWTLATQLGTDISAVAGCTGDLNRDGVVNSIDFGVFVNAYGDNCY